MGLFLDSQSERKVIYGNRDIYTTQFRGGIINEDTYRKRMQEVASLPLSILRSIDRKYDIRIDADSIKYAFNNALGYDGYKFKQDLSTEAIQSYITKAKNLSLRMSQLAANTVDIYDYVEINKSAFTDFALNVMDYSGTNYRENQRNKKIEEIIKSNDRLEKARLMNTISSELFNTDFSRYENLSDDELFDKGPSIVQRLHGLASTHNMYVAAVKEGIVYENFALNDKLEKLSARAFSLFEQIDMRLSMMANPISAVVDYKSMILHGSHSLKTDLLKDNESILVKETTPLLIEYNKMLFKHTEYVSNTSFNIRMSEAITGLITNNNIDSRDAKIVVEDKYNPDKFRSFDNIHDASEYLGDEALFTGSFLPNVYIVDSKNGNVVAYSVNPSLSSRGIECENIELGDDQKTNIKAFAEFAAHRSYLGTLYQKLDAENRAILKFSNSKEYYSVLNKMSEILHFVNTNETTLPEEALVQANNKLIELGNACNNYLQKKKNDFIKDGELNDISLNRCDIVNEIAAFANTACFGKRTEEFTKSQNLAASETFKFVDFREVGKFRMSNTTNPEIIISNMKKMRDALYDTSGFFTRDSREFQLLQHDLDKTISSIEKLKEIKGNDLSFEHIKTYLEDVNASLNDYKKGRESKNEALKAQGKEPNSRTMKRLEIADEFIRVTKEMGLKNLSQKERFVRRLEDDLVDATLRTDPAKGVHKLLNRDKRVQTMIQAPHVKIWFDLKSPEELHDVVLNFKQSEKAYVEMKAIKDKLQDPVENQNLQQQASVLNGTQALVDEVNKLDNIGLVK